MQYLVKKYYTKNVNAYPILYRTLLLKQNHDVENIGIPVTIFKTSIPETKAKHKYSN